MKSPVAKRSIVVRGHKTSVSLEDAFWSSLKEIGGERRLTLSDLVAAIDSQRQHSNLSSAIRLFVLDFYRAQLSAEGRKPDGSQHDAPPHLRIAWRHRRRCRQSRDHDNSNRLLYRRRFNKPDGNATGAVYWGKQLIAKQCIVSGPALHLDSTFLEND
jgi:predicted DNA-binding ribbon-helix-helix protein